MCLCAAAVPTSDVEEEVSVQLCFRMFVSTLMLGVGQSGSGILTFACQGLCWEGVGGVAFPEEVCHWTQLGHEGRKPLPAPFRCAPPAFR